jgi:hypothetical protein
MNDEFQSICMEVAMCVVPPNNYLEGLRKTTNIAVRIAGVPAKILTKNLQNKILEHTARQTFSFLLGHNLIN